MKDFIKRIFLKITSSKFILSIWATVMVTWIIVGKLTDFKILAYLLLIIPVEYIFGNIYQKYIENKLDINK